MPWHARLVPDVPVIETTYAGVLSPEEVGAAIVQTIELVRVHGVTSAENVRFWETACLNRGINSRIFSDRSTALEWLQSTRT